MLPTLAWLDFDGAERERTQRILALFDERETRDELGLGAIRDSISDHLFPGTSTIQTRLRYLFFVPWIYQELEKRHTSSVEVSAQAREMELDLTAPLLKAHGADAGVFGRVAKERLKRLPSSVYWAALRQYGICRYSGSREDYHHDFERLWRRQVKRKDEKEDGSAVSESTWHPKLPSRPANFPQDLKFKLTQQEAKFFRHCLEAKCPGSLLMFLAWNCSPADVDFPWEHPEYAAFPEAHKELLIHARYFSEMMHGAAILYNWMLAEAVPDDQRASDYESMFDKWMDGIRALRTSVRDWNLHRFWEVVRHPNHAITMTARQFVHSWITLYLNKESDLGKTPDARKLIRNRETLLKGARSRFMSRSALEQWLSGGGAGLNKIGFRWNNANQFLLDLWEGLQQQ